MKSFEGAAEKPFVKAFFGPSKREEEVADVAGGAATASVTGATGAAGAEDIFEQANEALDLSSLSYTGESRPSDITFLPV